MLAKSLGMEVEVAEEFAATDRSLVRFFVPAETRWRNVRNKTTGLGEPLTDNLQAIARENRKPEGVIDQRDFNASEGNQRILDDNTFSRLIEILSDQRLGLDDVQPDFLAAEAMSICCASLLNGVALPVNSLLLPI